MSTTPIYNMTDTWNDVGTSFTAVKMDVTDTASADGSLLLDLAVGGSSKFTVDKDGFISDALFGVADNSDRTKRVRLQASGITTGTTRTLTVADENGTIALEGNVGATVANYTALKALSAGRYNSVLVREAGRGGVFKWVSGDQSANVTADPDEAFWVPPDSDNTGASGAWQRIYENVIQFDWYNPAKDGATDDAAKINRALADLTDGQELVFAEADYAVASTISIGDGTTTTRSTVNSITLRFAGLPSHPEALRSQAFSGLPITGTRFTWTGASGGTVMKVNGPINGLVFRGIPQIRGIKSGGNRADFGFRAYSVSFSQFDGVAVYDCGDTNFELNAQEATTIGGDANGLTSGSNYWGMVISYAENADGACCFKLDGYKVSGGQNVTHNLFDIVHIGINPNKGCGLYLGFCDFNRIHQLIATNYTSLAPTISAITQANPGVVTTSSAHGLSNGDQVVMITAGAGMTELDGVVATVANVTSTTFELSGVDTSAYTAYTSGGIVNSADGILLAGTATPFTAPDLNFIEQASVGHYCTVRGTNTPGENYIHAFSTNDGGIPPYGVSGISGHVVSDDIDSGLGFGECRQLIVNATGNGDGVHFYLTDGGANPSTRTDIGSLTRQTNDMALSSFAGFGLQLGTGAAGSSYDVFFTSSGDMQFAGTTRVTNAGVATFTQTNVDNLRLDGNTLSSTDTNGDVNITPNGTGKVVAGGDGVSVPASGAVKVGVQGNVGATMLWGISRGAASGNGAEYRSFDDHRWTTGGTASTSGTTTMSLTSAGALNVIGAYQVDGTQVVTNQQTTGVAEATFVENSGGTAVNVDSTFGGYTLQQVVQALQNHGLLA